MKKLFQSPVGPLCIEANEESLLSITFNPSDIDPSESKKSNVIDHCIAELDQYFKGTLKTFTVPLLLNGTAFQNKVWSELTKIPYGKTISYSELALRLGDVKCIRAAGTANGKNKLPIIIPCHRVIGKDGQLVGFAGGLDKKEWLLKHEGIIKGAQMKIFG
ncbi:methylated-DNA--[protein]-cysteine S-methyltransferase [Fulvivirga sediminis]|uniref:Methylated-DNA--protein-cysteine methyltransferase n=1 Tax=Fulvivirga sediminis TaxID=2803949 RepID=A0A937F5U3_9BACT|nr:methylated-DNA--[protein]-cysteine S-methyltransferase [Fulvivirga sediminis]MBL3656972.1 methylated-DNA--[protein]-cysteine S-methyltransferase [Fulvivirga sediminis]